jgi:hypothetical protein
MVFSMVHHIRAEGDEFVPTQHGKEDNKGHGEKDNKEHMFAFVEGLATHEIGQLTNLIHRWQDVVKDHCMEIARVSALPMSHFFCPFYSQGSNSTFYSVLLRKSGDADFAIF